MIPLKQSEFKPRVNKNVCQYCGYTKMSSHEVDVHVNNQHEFNIWYRCNKCIFMCFNRPTIRRHFDTVHKMKIVKDEVENLVIQDATEIQKLRGEVIKERKLNEKLKNSKKSRKSEANLNFFAVDKSEFKVRTDPKICQYCGFKGKDKDMVDQHVNSHELTNWYRCTYCKNVSPWMIWMRSHIRKEHDHLVTYNSIKNLIIKDETEIDRLRKMKYQERKTKEECSNLSQNMQRAEPRFIPIARANFKGRIYPNVCQYCGHTSNRGTKGRSHIDDHVNSMHEMTSWFKCQSCNHASLRKESIVSHARVIHNEYITIQDVKLCLIMDQVEIDRLKQNKIKEKQAVEEISKLAPDQLNKKSTYIPINKEDFRPRMNSRICQYCGYSNSRTRAAVDLHVNVNHELTTWYKCHKCNFTTLHSNPLKRHLQRQHLQKDVTPASVRKSIVTDTEEISRLREEWIKKKHINEEFSKLPPASINKTPKFIPINKANIKSRIYPKVCQYCGFTGKEPSHIDDHVNAMHEMTDWYKCPKCQFFSVTTRPMRTHLTIQHLMKDISEHKLRQCIIHDQEKIDQLKQKRIQGKIAKGKSKLVTPFKKDFKPRTNPKICQYCGHKGKDSHAVDIHVNSKHEMTHWYKCEHCEWTTLNSQTLKDHLKLWHSEKGMTEEKLRTFLVRDQAEIDRLRRERIEQKNSEDKLVKLKVELCEKVRKMVPSNVFEFKPRINPKVCQYCGLKSVSVCKADQHINNVHEMIFWYKCDGCNESATDLKQHLGVHAYTENLSVHKSCKN